MTENQPQDTLPLAHGSVPLPAFLPDATLGFVRALDAAGLEQCGVQAVVMNVFHLMQRPGSSTVAALGGLHGMSGWQRPIITDSGGFQAYSYIRERGDRGRIADDGLVWRPEAMARDFKLTPEKSIQLQLRYGADVVICLDQCTDAADDAAFQELAVRRTIAWARRCRREFDRLVSGREHDRRLLRRRADAEPADGDAGQSTVMPKLFAVVQGGAIPELRRSCAEALLDIGFDGYGFGGWPLDERGALLTETVALVRDLIPAHYPLHALGVGHPLNVIACARLGYTLFDSALPTRDARHGRLYTTKDGLSVDELARRGEGFAFTYVLDAKHAKDRRPLMDGCDCAACVRYSTGFLHHLSGSKDGLYSRLATMHNLRFMTSLMAALRGGNDVPARVEDA